MPYAKTSTCLMSEQAHNAAPKASSQQRSVGLVKLEVGMAADVVDAKMKLCAVERGFFLPLTSTADHGYPVGLCVGNRSRSVRWLT